MHAATIKSIGTDAGGRLVLTVSDDKTARLWELEPSGKSSMRTTLLRTFRIPVGDGAEGKLSAGALSRDGSLAAVAGFTGAIGQEKSIYLFDTGTGRLVRRISGLPNVVVRLAFSPKETALAAVMNGKGTGLVIFDPATGQRLAADSEYEDGSYDVEWQGDSLLATTCLDGKLRLYHGDPTRLSSPAGPVAGPRWKPAAVTTLRQWGRQPFMARFSPDGRRLGVGFLDLAPPVVLIPGQPVPPTPNTPCLRSRRAILRLAFFPKIAAQPAHEQTNASANQRSEGAEENRGHDNPCDLYVRWGRRAGGDGHGFRDRHRWGTHFPAVRPEHREEHVDLGQDKPDNGKRFGKVAARHEMD
jgi:hypothetical protein